MLILKTMDDVRVFGSAYYYSNIAWNKPVNKYRKGQEKNTLISLDTKHRNKRNSRYQKRIKATVYRLIAHHE